MDEQKLKGEPDWPLTIWLDLGDPAPISFAVVPTSALSQAREERDRESQRAEEADREAATLRQWLAETNTRAEKAEQALRPSLPERRRAMSSSLPQEAIEAVAARLGTTSMARAAVAVAAAYPAIRERALDEVREKLLSDRAVEAAAAEITPTPAGLRSPEVHTGLVRFGLRAALDTLSENKPQDRDRGGL